MEPIFSHQEVHERFTLHQFIYNIGVPVVKAQSNTSYGITPEELLEAFTVDNPNELTIPMVQNLLLQGGFIHTEEKYIKLYLKINPATFNKLSTETQNKVIKWVDGPLSITLRKLMLGYTKNPEGLLTTPLEIFLNRFMHIYCFDDRKKFGNLLNTNTRASMAQMYSYYLTVCASMNYQNTLGKKQFIEALRKLGYKTRKGYVRGVSGVNFIDHYHIPQTTEDLQESIYCGMGIMMVDRYRITTECQLYSVYTTEALEQLHNTIERRMLDFDSNEQSPEKEGKQEKEELQEGTDLGDSEYISEEISIKESEQKTKTVLYAESYIDSAKDNDGDYGGDDTTNAANTNTNTTITDTSNGVCTNADASNRITHDKGTFTPTNTTYASRGPKQITRKNTTGSHKPNPIEALDPMAGKDALLSGAPEMVVDITTIAEALKTPLMVLFNNDIKAMTKEVMQQYLDMMHVDINIDDVYDGIIEYLS